MTTQPPSPERSTTSGPPKTVEALTAAAARLQAEHEAASEDAARSVLLHEIASLLERAGDDPGAARDYLASFNADSEFREPLEALVALLHRRRSVKNLGKLLDALVRAAATPAETTRALVERAAFLIEQQGDSAAARGALREATAESPDEVTPWLELEILAGKEADAAGRLEALEERAARAEPPTWRALLLLDAAELQAQAGDAEKASATCRTAAEIEGAARFRAYVMLADLARRERNDHLLAEALEAQAAQVLEALADGAKGDALGVPRWVRSSAFVADAWLRAAEARRRGGDVDGAAALVDGAATRLPDEPAIAAAQLALADATGHGERAAEIAKRLLEQGAAGPEAASLWIRIEEDAAGKGDRDAVLAALASALAADPACIPARALQLDFLGTQDGEKEGTVLAASLEAAAEQLPSDEGKARAYLRAAWEWATAAKDVAGAKAALSQAGALGIPPATLSRVARALAGIIGDTAWYEEATRRLLAAKAAENEAAGLWLEILRGRLLRGDSDGAAKALESLAAAPGGAWMGRVLAAYLSGGEDKKPGAAALDALAQSESDPDLTRALTIAAALRAERAGDRDGAKARLARLLDVDASDVVAVSYLAQLSLQTGDAVGAANVFESAASAADDPSLGASFAIEAGLLRWASGARSEALAPLRAAHAAAPAAAAPLLAWATRAVDPDRTESRRDALELATQAGEDSALVALERFGLEVGPGGDAEDARSALEALEREGHIELRLAAALVRMTWPAVVGDRDRLGDALTLVEETSRGGATIARGERLRIARDFDQARVDAASHAASWAASDPSLAPALEWLAAAATIEDRDGEAAAHRLIAQFLEGDARAAEESAATLLSWLTVSGGLPSLVSSSEPSAQLMNLELSVSGCDPRRRSAALRGVGTALGDDAVVDALSLAAWSDLAAGDAPSAVAAFRTVAEARPTDVTAWEGLCAAATQISDGLTAATASAKLGELIQDDARAAEKWEHAGLLYIDVVGDEDLGDQALLAAFDRDPRRGVAFDKLFRRMRARDADDAVLELAVRRLEVAEDSAEIIKLYWEQARVLRKKGDYDAALDALGNVTMLEPDHVGALALTGEIHIKKGSYPDAAEALSRLAARPEAPPQQRLISGVAAVDLFEKRLGQIDRALEVLVLLHKAGLSTLPVRERLATIAARARAWPDATSMLEELMVERDTAEGRVSAARLAMAIWRDEVREPAKARKAVTKLLAEAPADAEAVDLLLAFKGDDAWVKQLLSASRNSLVSRVERGKLDSDAVARLARVARALGDSPLVQASLGVLVTLGRDEPGIAEELAALDQRVAKVPQIQIDETVLAHIGDPGDAGPLVRLFAVLGETIGEALGPSKDALGVGRKERIEPRSGLPLRNDVAAWCGALGLGEFELYVGGRDPNGVQGVAGEVPALVVGQAVTSPLSAASRQAIAREIFALRRGITVVRSRDEATVAALAVAACNLVEMRLEAPAFAILGDVQRQLGKALSRKVKKLLPEICNEVVASRPDVRAWASAAQRSLDRMATVAAGDVSLVLADVLTVPRAELKRAVPGNDRAERILRFVLSPQYLELRARLGMGVR
jgi:hypothetical protein